MVTYCINIVQCLSYTQVSDTLSPNRDPCVTILSVSLNVVHACSIVVHKWVWMLGYILPCFFAFFSNLFSIFNIFLH